MTDRPVVYTAVFGGFDEIAAPARQTVEASWCCFTDDPDLPVPDPWVRFVVPSDHPAMRYDHPRMRTIWFKAFPPYRPRWSIWIDANITVFNERFVAEIIEASPSGFSTYAHPTRDCIYEEAAESLRLQPAKYAGLPLREQVEHYRTAGHPEHGGLYAVGVIARDGSLPVVDEIGCRWLDECERWTYQTQLSLPVVCRELGVWPDVYSHSQIPCDMCVPGAARGNPWLHIGTHLKDG